MWVRLCRAGSVSPKNAQDLAKKEDIDGFLVGGASLKVRHSGITTCIVAEDRQSCCLLSQFAAYIFPHSTLTPLFFVQGPDFATICNSVQYKTSPAVL